MKNKKQYILDLLNAIETQSDITPKNQSIRISLKDKSIALFDEILLPDYLNIIEILETDNVIKVIKKPDVWYQNGFIYYNKDCPGTNALTQLSYFFEKGENFYECFNNLKKDFPDIESSKIIEGDNKYEIFYDERVREITINKKTCLAKPDFGSENEIFFSYVFKHPNENLLMTDIKKETGNLGKDIHTILNNLGFRGNFKKAFFNNASTKAVFFRNPVTKEELQELGINKLI